MTATKHATSEVTELIDLLKRYVVQETVGPLRTIGRTLGYGAGAAVMFGLGGVFVLIGLLRALESETGTTFRGDWSWAPYGLTVLGGMIVLGLAAALLLRSPKAAQASSAAGSSPPPEPR